jgi:hypothetical protein
VKGWTRSLFWEGFPFLMLFGVSGLLAVINWDYERKLFMPDPSADNWRSVHLGQIMLAIALAQALVGSAILLLVRLLNPNVLSKTWLLVPLTLVFIFLVLPGLFVVVFGPAAITMIQQKHVVPR